MEYFVLFKEDGESPDNFKAYQTLDEAVTAAKAIIARDFERISDDYYIKGVDPDTFPEVVKEFSVFGEEL